MNVLYNYIGIYIIVILKLYKIITWKLEPIDDYDVLICADGNRLECSRLYTARYQILTWIFLDQLKAKSTVLWGWRANVD